MRPSRSTLHSETVTLRQILKTANRKGWISALPDMTVTYKASGKVTHRAWFSPADGSPGQWPLNEVVYRMIARRRAEKVERLDLLSMLLHARDANGKIDANSRERFSLFLLGWLGGPGEYEARYGHPRLRMRHGRVPIDLAMRDAWLRCMDQALTDCGVTGELRTFLDERFAHVANFLRNVPR